MKRLAFFLLLLLLGWSACTYGQLRRYKWIINSNQPGKVFRQANYDDTSWVTYLGVLKDANQKTVFHVVKEFYKVRAAATWHGHSVIYFFDNKRSLVAKCYPDMPDRLPVKLKDNTFYFEYLKDGAAKKYEWTIPLPLPNDFRCRPDEVYMMVFL